MRPRIAAVVPMRHESERVPGKNYRPCAGKPLFYWIVEALATTGAVDAIVIDTDSPTIGEYCRQDFPDVVVLERPEHLRDGGTPMNEVLLSTTERVSADVYLQTHSTNPLLRSETIGAAIKGFSDRRSECDSLFSVTPLQTRLWDELVRPINHNPALLLRTQDLPPVYEENSCIYLFTREGLRESQNRIGKRPLMWPIPAEEAVDIDDEMDFRIAEMMCELRLEGRGGSAG